MHTLVLAGIGALSLSAVAVSGAAQDAAPQSPPQTADPQTADEANAEAPPLPTTTTVIPGEAPNEPDLIIEDHHGNMTPPPEEALNREYPVCTDEVTDECRNPAEREDRAAASDEAESAALSPEDR